MLCGGRDGARPADGWVPGGALTTQYTATAELYRGLGLGFGCGFGLGWGWLDIIPPLCNQSPPAPSALEGGGY